MSLSEKQWRGISWIVLGSLLAVTLAGSVLYHRAGWDGPVAGEATYLMQAQSLAFDFDLAYTRDDFDRATAGWGTEPKDLELTSGSGGRRIAYDRPFPYALYLAPFVRLGPETGFAVANALALIAAAVFAAFVLEAVLGATAALWVAVLVFASATFGYVFLATGDLFLMVLTVFAWGLVARHRGERLSDPTPSGWTAFAAGALLAVPLATEPLYGFLALAAVFALPRGKDGGRGALLLGLAAGVLVQVAAQWWWSGGLHFTATTRFRFTPETGFPLVDFTAGEWNGALGRLSALHWDEAPRWSWGLDPLLWLWDALYLAVGRHVGILPYFLPVLALWAGGSLRGHRRPLALAVAAWLVLIVVVHPFNLFGGEGAIANRLFLPVYGAAFFLLGRHLRVPWAVGVVALSALFLGPLWSTPWSPPIVRGEGYRHVGAVASRFLPYETSQRWLPANQMADLPDGLRVRLLNDGVWWEARRERLVLDSHRRAEMVVASPVPLEGLELAFGPDAPSQIELRGATLGERLLGGDGGIVFHLDLDSPARRHALWWSPERHWIYLVSFELPRDGEGSLGFELRGRTAAVEER